jgi:hypothetical protein
MAVERWALGVISAASVALAVWILAVHLLG